MPSLKRPCTINLVDVSGIAQLSGITTERRQVCIHANATHREVASSEVVRSLLPGLSALAGSIGDPAVRNRGTIGGSVATNHPAYDYPAALLSLDASIVTDRRSVPFMEFHKGPFITALLPDEVVVKITFPVEVGCGYAKVASVASGYPLCGVFVTWLTEGGVRVAVTGAGRAGAFRAVNIEEMIGREGLHASLQGLTIELDDLLGDVHGSRDYRAALIPILARRALFMAR